MIVSVFIAVCMVTFSYEPEATSNLTARQCQALEWLERVGKTSLKRAIGQGFAQRTMDALVDAGYATRDRVGVIAPAYVYRIKPVRDV